MKFEMPRANLVVSLIEPPCFSNTSGDLDHSTPVPTKMAVLSGNCKASRSKIMQSHFDFCSHFLRNHTRTSGTFKSDFLLCFFVSRCCLFVYLHSAIEIAPITNHFSFEFITLVAVRGPFTSCWYPIFVNKEPNFSFHILRNDLPLFSFSLFVASMHLALSQHNTWVLDSSPVDVCNASPSRDSLLTGLKYELMLMIE